VPSPYEIVLGRAFDSLHPRLKQYFAAVPEGAAGIGSGSFAVVGSPRFWLWPMLWILGRQGVVFPAWRRRVPFTVLNGATVDARGNTAVLGIRTFRFRLGDRTMTDAITAERRGLVDYLGPERRWRVLLSATVIDGELRMTSTSIAVRFGRLELNVPNSIAPTVSLTERFDDGSDRQQVSLAIDSPQLGRLYEYSGSFSYRIVGGS
jgi:hypothetical protein